MNAFKLDIKNDSLFKNIFLRDEGRKYMCSIISELLNLNYEDLLENVRLYGTEHPNNDANKKSSFSDVIYGYKNKIFIIEMNKILTKKLVSKNYYYLLFRHTFDANNENDYNYEKLTNLEKDCLLFIENDKEILRENIKNKYLEGVIKKMEVAEMDEVFYPLYDRENLELSLREETKVLGREEMKKEIVKSMYDRKYTLEQIADVVKISLVDIRDILKDRIN